MTVKDKITGKVLNTNSVWLQKEWKRNPKRYVTNFKLEEEEKPQKKSSSKDKEVENDGNICK